MNFFVCARKIDELFEDVIPQAGETAGRVQASHQQIYDRSDVVIMSDDEQIVDRVLDQGFPMPDVISSSSGSQRLSHSSSCDGNSRKKPAS